MSGETMLRIRAAPRWCTPISVKLGRVPLLAVIVVIALLAASCSSGGQQGVFSPTGGFTLTMNAQTQEVNDIGLTWGYLDNATNHPVHVMSIQFVEPPRGLRIQNVLAYTWQDVHDIGILTESGVLPKECPDEFKPHPLTVVTVAPHSNANWLVVIAFTISKPGVYQLNQIRIDYETQGHAGWQYQNVNTTVTVKNPPLPGPTPLPPSSLCYSANVPPS